MKKIFTLASEQTQETLIVSVIMALIVTFSALFI